MREIRAALYARVSSEQQAAAHTIESQIASLSERAQADGARVSVLVHPSRLTAGSALPISS